MDIKELALKVAGMDELMGPRDTFAFTKERMADFATRLIAAYCEGQEPVARVIDGGGELHLPKLQWVSANHSLETPIGSKLFTAPPEPAFPHCEKCGSSAWMCSVCHPRPAACAAPSSEEVRKMVERLYGDIDGGPNSWLKQEAADLIERLAARVPDGCVVVPIADLKNAAGSYEEGDGQSCIQILNRLIAAGEVKP